MDPEELKKAIEAVMTGFEQFKATNEDRLKQIETKGAADVLTVEKLGKIETALASFEGLNQKLTLEQKAREKVEAEIKALDEAWGRFEAKLGRPGAGGDGDAAKKSALEYKTSFDAYCRHQHNDLAQEHLKRLNEYKTLIASSDTLGGYYLSPAEMANEIIKAIILQSPMRTLARVTAIGVASLKLPKRTGTFAAKRVGEIASRTETTGYTAGLVEIPCPEMYAEVHISEQMIEDSAYDIQAEMQLEFSEQFAVKEGAEFISGTGAENQAEGVLNNSGTTVVVSGAATTINNGDAIVDLFYKGLKTGYAKNATFIMNRQTLGSVRKLKDGVGNYLWTPGIAGNVPNTILGAPYAEMPDMPNEGAGTFPIAVGDWMRAYRVVDRVLISVLRDPFTQAGSGQILFRARKRVGGAVTLGEAIAKLKCST